MIEDMRSQYLVTELCEVMEVSLSGYYKWRLHEPSARTKENDILLTEIKAIHDDGYYHNYGSPRMCSELLSRGYHCSENRVARLMASAGLSARFDKKWKPRTTQQNLRHHPSPNHLKKIPEVTSAGQVWVSDITYVFTRSETYYLAVVMDLYTRQILGWEFDSHMESSLVLKAIKQAEKKFPEISGQRMFHSDRGSQYTSKLVRAHLKDQDYLQSMSALGYCYDNAACESFFASLKKESFPKDQTFDTPVEARRTIFSYLETFYNSRRLHTSLGMRSPNEFYQLNLPSN